MVSFWVPCEEGVGRLAHRGPPAVGWREEMTSRGSFQPKMFWEPVRRRGRHHAKLLQARASMVR